MLVPAALSGLSELASLGKRGEVADIKSAVMGKAASIQSALTTPSAAMRQIVSQYDMTDITPSDFSNLIQQLSAKGAVSQKDLQELSSIPLDLTNAGIKPDESVNLLEFYQQQIANAQSSATQPPNAAAATQPPVGQLFGRMGWVQKFAAVRQQGGQNGMNAVA